MDRPTGRLRQPSGWLLGDIPPTRDSAGYPGTCSVVTEVELVLANGGQRILEISCRDHAGLTTKFWSKRSIGLRWESLAMNEVKGFKYYHTNMLCSSCLVLAPSAISRMWSIAHPLACLSLMEERRRRWRQEVEGLWWWGEVPLNNVFILLSGRV